MRTNLYNLTRVSFRYLLFTFPITTAFALIILFNANGITQQCLAEVTKIPPNEITEKADKIFTNRHCPCQCNRYLPGSTKSPACFGCSAGKAEIDFVMESIKSGRETSEILMDLNSPIIIDVFADYTNKDIAKVWKLVKAVSRKLNQNRVVLRTPGLTPEARRAVQVAEYARLNGNFSMVQDALIKHNGPWDWSTLIALITNQNQSPDRIQEYVPVISIITQIAKDQQHAKERGVDVFPTTTINNQITLNTENAIRQTIKNILLIHSI
jgi:hypothetical protein